MVRVTVNSVSLLFAGVNIDHADGVRYKVSKKKKVLRVFNANGDEIARHRAWIRVTREFTETTER